MSTRRFRAPGRVNIIGEHIDYLGGTVLPFACDRELVVTADYRDGPIEFASDTEGIDVYVDGVVHALEEASYQIVACSGEVRSTIPVGAGLSSSAALEAGIALALTAGAAVTPNVLQRAEHMATGVPSGVMDQTAVLHAMTGHALLLDCATGTFDQIPIDPAIGFVVIDTGTRRELADGRYAQRRAEVEAGHPKRRRHAETEQARVFAAADALRAGDPSTLGALLNESHASLRDDFEVSSPELDLAVETSRRHGSCHGARLVGGGFAGCAVAIVDAGAENDLAAWIAEQVPRMNAFGVRTVEAAGELTG